MAKIIHGSDQYNAVEVAWRTSSGDDPGYPSAYSRVPMAGETGTVQREVTPQSSEITAAGALKVLDYGPGHWRMQLKTRLYYNARWQHLFWSHLFGGLEALELNRLLTGAAAAPSTTANAHWFIPQSYKCTSVGSESAIPWGLSLRLSKMGPDNVDGYIHKILGAYITGATIEAVQGQWPIVTWDILGPEPSVLDGDGITPAGADASDYAVGPRDLSMDNAHPLMPSLSSITNITVPGTRNVMSLRIRIDNKLNFPGRFLTAYDTDWNIGHTGQVEVTADFETLLEQAELNVGAPGGKVYPFFIAGGALPTTLRRFRFISAPSGSSHSKATPMVDATNNIPYGLEFASYLATYLSAPAPIETGGALRMRWSERWFIGQFPSSGHANSATYKAPIMISAQVAQTDEPSIDTKMGSTAQGSNDPHSTLV